MKIILFLSVLFSALAYIPYIKAILQTRNTPTPIRPNRATWFVWSLVDVIVLLSLQTLGSTSAMVPFVVYFLGSSVVFFLSLKYGEGGFTKLDIICVLISLAGVVYWKTFDTAMAGVLGSMIAAYAGSAPTIQKSIKDPWSEDLLTYVLLAIGGFFACLAIREWTHEKALTPISVFVIQIVLVLSIYIPRKIAKPRVAP